MTANTGSVNNIAAETVASMCRNPLDQSRNGADSTKEDQIEENRKTFEAQGRG
jgi:hypothetical protein